MKLRSLAAIAAMLSAGIVAHADTFTTFDITGTLQSGSTLSGTLTLDETTGLFTQADITASSPDSLTFDTSYGSFQQPCTTQCNFGVDYAGSGFFGIAIVSGSLVGYQGGHIGGELVIPNTPTDFLTGDGRLSPVPEPSSIVLFGTALLAGAGAIRQRLA